MYGGGGGGVGGGGGHEAHVCLKTPPNPRPNNPKSSQFLIMNSKYPICSVFFRSPIYFLLHIGRPPKFRTRKAQ